ncbi:hypothetical protein HU200_067473 [Digitaria exilis]|uniref:WRKY domain-containing protein n=1 Tax=Digitaria exilis TaxID=1010633 RepID=A0A834ZYR8_9POAL|nr:hypothetical protein HU200_067473 [Digitaria exilis]
MACSYGTGQPAAPTALQVSRRQIEVNPLSYPLASQLIVAAAAAASSCSPAASLLSLSLALPLYIYIYRGQARPGQHAIRSREAMEEARSSADDDAPLERRRSSSCNNNEQYYHYWNSEDGARRRRESMVNKLISTVYSGPTISDIESALSFTGGDQQQLLTMDNSSATSSPSAPKVLSKMENKYTLKIKTASGNGGLAEDGYKWRKYGQKSIKNSPNPRSYYRCTNPRCNAKKQVERATDEADTLLVTYEGLHLHYTYSPQHLLQQPAAVTSGSSKKPKLQQPRGPAAVIDDGCCPTAQQPAQDDDGPSSVVGLMRGPTAIIDDGLLRVLDAELFQQQQQSIITGEEEELTATYYCTTSSSNNHHNDEGGLLEDVVPLLVRRPCTASTSLPPSTSSSSVVSWNPYTIDMAILSNIF